MKDLDQSDVNADAQKMLQAEFDELEASLPKVEHTPFDLAMLIAEFTGLDPEEVLGSRQFQKYTYFTFNAENDFANTLARMDEISNAMADL